MANVTWNFSDRCVAVTGSAAGMGAAAVAAFASSGARVYGLDVEPEAGQAVVDAAVASGGDARFIEADVTSSVSVERAFSIIESEGGLDVLINNAGGFWDQRTTERTTEDEWDEVVDLNLKGVFLCARSAIPLLRRSVAGRIVNISSLVAQTAMYRSSPPYAAAKAGVLALSRVLAYELAGDGITCNAVSPSAVLTERIYSVRDSEEREATARSIPLGRYGEVNEIVHVMMFLASDESGYITGQTVSANGGRFMA